MRVSAHDIEELLDLVALNKGAGAALPAYAINDGTCCVFCCCCCTGD
jgi:hypothetical protein